MSVDTAEKISMNPFPEIAAEVRWNDEQKYGNKEGQRRRLAEMCKAGIVSEVLDLIEALEIQPAEATQALITTYGNAATSAEFLSEFWQQQGNHELAEQRKIQAQNDRSHADMLKKDDVTLAQELAARAKQREALELPNNVYKILLSKPVFPK